MQTLPLGNLTLSIQFFFRVPHGQNQVLDNRQGHAYSEIGSLSPTTSSPNDLEQIISLKVTWLQYHTNVILKNSDDDYVFIFIITGVASYQKRGFTQLVFPGKKFCGLLNCVFKFALSEESLPRDRSLQLTTCRGFYLMVEDGWFLETIPSDLLPRLKHLRLSFLSNQSSSRYLSVCRKKIYLALNLMSTSLSLCNMKFSFGKENL